MAAYPMEKRAGGLFRQNKLAEFGGLQPVTGAIVFNHDRFLALE
jgi:hypothetical protein